MAVTSNTLQTKQTIGKFIMKAKKIWIAKDPHNSKIFDVAFTDPCDDVVLLGDKLCEWKEYIIIEIED